MTTHRPLAPVGRPLDQQRFDTQRDSLTSTSIYFDDPRRESSSEGRPRNAWSSYRRPCTAESSESSADADDAFNWDNTTADDTEEDEYCF